MKKQKGSKENKAKEREKRSCEIYRATTQTNQVMWSGDMNACVTLIQEWSYIGASDWTKQKPTVWNTTQWWRHIRSCYTNSQTRVRQSIAMGDVFAPLQLHCYQN